MLIYMSIRMSIWISVSKSFFHAHRCSGGFDGFIYLHVYVQIDTQLVGHCDSRRRQQPRQDVFVRDNSLRYDDMHVDGCIEPC